MFICKTKREINRAEDLLLITGDGKPLPEDLQRFLSWGLPHDVMCIGRSIQIYPGEVGHYADVDADAGKWVIDNMAKNHPDKGTPLTHTLGEVDWFDVCWEIEDCPIKSDEILWHGSTGLFATLIGLAMGYRRVALAGVPMDSKGHWYFGDETYGPKWTMESYQAWLEFAATPGAKKVVSLSGYTRTILGSINSLFALEDETTLCQHDTIVF